MITSIIISLPLKHFLAMLFSLIEQLDSPKGSLAICYAPYVVNGPLP